MKLLHINATPQCITRNPTNIAWCIMAHRRRCLKHRTPRHFYQKCVWLLHLLLVAHHQTFQFNAEQSIQQRREKKNLVHFPIIFDSIILEMKIEIQCCYSTIATRQIRPENCLNHNTNRDIVVWTTRSTANKFHHKQNRNKISACNNQASAPRSTEEWRP